MGVASVKRGREPGRTAGTPLQMQRELWKGRRPSPFAAAGLARRRLGSGWQLLLAVGLGILVAVVLISTVPLYSTLVSNIQLQATINQAGALGRNIEIQAVGSPFTATVSQQEDHLVRQYSQQYLSGIIQPTITNYDVADPMLISSVGATPYDLQAPLAPQVQFEAFDYAATAAHMHLIQGTTPQPPSPGTSATAYDALITQQMATEQHITLGDLLTGAEFGAHDKQIPAKVVGIWQPVDPNEAFWNGLSFQAVSTDTTPAVYPVLLDKTAFVAAVTPIADLNVTQHWIEYTTTARITTDNMGAIPTNIGTLKSHLAGDFTALGVNVAVVTALDKSIADVQNQLALLGLPLYIVVAQVVGLALLFVVAMASLLVDGQTVEIATLKSRGASGAQLLGSYTAQGLLLGGIAAVAGPWLAALLALALVRIFVPAATVSGAGAGGAYLQSLANPAAVVLPAVAGGLLGAGAVIFAAQRASRLDVLAIRREQGRSTRQPFWRRYYLDLGLAVICGLGFLELGQFGGEGTRAILGQGASSPLLLAAPALLLLAGALLLLRLFPLVATAGARLFTRGRGATGVLAFAQVARNPAGPSRLALLLALGVGLGLFALTFDASLQLSATDRAAYQTGADLRLQENHAEASKLDSQIQQRLLAIPGVTGISPAYRVPVTTTSDNGNTSINLLAIDPTSWNAVAGATWRGDYAATPIATLLGQMTTKQYGAAADDQAGKTQAGDAGHPVWAIVSQTFADAVHVHAGDRFALTLPDSVNAASFFVVGAIVQEFPTLYPAGAVGGFIVVNIHDCLGAINLASSGATTQSGPNEYWLSTTSNPAGHAAAAQKIAQLTSTLDLSKLQDRTQLQQSIASNPVQAGMRGLLTVGALIAAALAVLGSIVQSALAARQRVVQFAVLRTMGMASRQLAGLLLGEQLVVYLFGLLGGTVLGAVLASATLPYLQFSDTTIDPATLGIPPYRLALDVTRSLEFYAVLAVAFIVALVIAARFAARVGLGKTLRLGED
ncbi:MAG TPA: FtsX-like permease family protein [Ktedonobacterales bacterium]|nr:FtsX-like permease family protein [Ktedonobacterales bacterium]